ESGLEEQLWMTLDDTPHHEGIRNIIRNWLQQTGLTDTLTWIQRCQTVLTKTKAPSDDGQQDAKAKPTGGIDLQDEEVAGFAASSGEAKDGSASAIGSGQE